MKDLLGSKWPRERNPDRGTKGFGDKQRELDFEKQRELGVGNSDKV